MSFERIVLPEELWGIDRRSEVWGRVTADKPRITETPIYRAMREYGGFLPEKNKDDDEPLPPLTREQIMDGWLLDKAWRNPNLTQRNKNILQLWYIGRVRNPVYIAKTLRCRRDDVAGQLRDALHAFENVARLIAE